MHGFAYDLTIAIISTLQKGEINNFALLHFLCLVTDFYFNFFMRKDFLFFHIGSIIDRMRGHKYCRMLINLVRPRAHSWPHCLLAVLLWTNFWTTCDFNFFSHGNKAFLIGFWELNENSQNRKTAQWWEALNNDFSERRLPKHFEERHASHNDILVN